MTTTEAGTDVKQPVRAVIPPESRAGVLLKSFRATRAWLALTVAVLLWEGLVRALDTPKYVLPAPTAMIEQFTEHHELFLNGLWATTRMSLYGLAAAIVIGVVLGVAMGRSALFEELAFPFLNIIRVMPTVAIAPLLIIWFGRGGVPIVICSCLIAVFPIIVDVAHGLTSVDEDLVNMMKLANASELSILLRVRIPNALPYLFSSFRVAAPGAVVGALLGEYIGSREGLGYLITVYSAQLNTAAVFVLALLSCLVGLVFFNVCVWLEKILVPWKTVVR
ncbi:ABC transporter permease [Kineosporia succinea]|uniref:ABC-type nitrate/sulfonate/bicarbonate transport system permease component n=1 Tax=Kineosporia succinea TaxID=84632 RepID=A0ABT9P9A8_9ACTN|nr:ABC transporter permease [Kineosporia succinea]MDP9829288.1 ABC-type nitrate/sulfonate/bicarbonate transport system permease component [Kineosporia succinea]